MRQKKLSQKKPRRFSKIDSVKKFSQFSLIAKIKSGFGSLQRMHEKNQSIKIFCWLIGYFLVNLLSNDNWAINIYV